MRATAIALLLVVVLIIASVAYVAYQRGFSRGMASGWRQDRADLLMRLEAHGVLGDGSQEKEVFQTLKQLLIEHPEPWK